MLAGLAIRGWAAGVLAKDRELAVTGPYSFTRNPLYLGTLVIGLGGWLAAATLWPGLLFVAFFAWIYRAAIASEDESLIHRFGDRYRHYRDSVPALFPRIGSPVRPPPPSGSAPSPAHFRVERYLRNREWEALLGALAAFALLALKLAW